MRFRTVVELGGKTATGLEIPSEVVTGLGAGHSPAVAITVNGYTYRTTVARRGGRYLVPLSGAHRTAAGVTAGDEVEVDVVLDDQPREVQLPADLQDAMDDAARSAYDALSYSHRKEWVRWIEEAKKPETRAARVRKTVDGLRAGRRTH